MIPLEDRLHTTEELAEILHCKREHAQYLARKRKITRTRNGRRFLFAKKHILEYLNSQEVEAL